jgi:hypothetical protein
VHHRACYERQELAPGRNFFGADPEHWVVFDVFVDDVALPLIEPRIP